MLHPKPKETAPLPLKNNGMRVFQGELTWSCPFLEPARGSRRHAAPPGREAAAGEMEEKNPGLGDLD
jgi:hypothetical protein